MANIEIESHNFNEITNSARQLVQIGSGMPKLTKTPRIKFRKYACFWGDQKIHLAFYNGCLWEKKFWSIKNKKDISQKIILHNYVLYKGDPTYVGTFPVNIRMTPIFTDFPTEIGSAPHAALEISDVNIRGFPDSTGKVPTLVGSHLHKI